MKVRVDYVMLPAKRSKPRIGALRAYSVLRDTPALVH
jgi:hypothetical protein